MAYLGTGGTAVLTASDGFDRRHACVSADPVRRRYRQCLYDDFPLDHHFQSVGSHPAGWLAEPAFWRRWLGYHSIGHRDRSGLCAGFGLANELVCPPQGVSAIAFMAVVWLMGVDDYEPPVSRAGNRPWFGTPALAKITLAYAIFGAGYIVTATFLIAIVRQSDGGFVVESGVWLAAGLAGAPSVWLWSLVARRFGLATAFGIGCVVEAVGVVASVSIGGYGAQLLAGALSGRNVYRGYGDGLTDWTRRRR